MSKVRIQKVLAEAGAAARRAVEEMILAGRVEVNGKVVTRLPCFVDPATDRIRVDGKAVSTRPAPKVYVLVNKPRGVVCARGDPHGRPRIYDIVPPIAGAVYCVAALDVDSTGAVLLTNDGDLANRLSHPRYGVARTYVVEVDGRVDGPAVGRLTSGVVIGGRRVKPRRVKLLRRGPRRSVLEIELVESAGREVRPMLARLGYKTRKLKRTGIGPLSDKGVRSGAFRVLDRRQVTALTRAADGRKR